jgi:hypothetical protein
VFGHVFSYRASASTSQPQHCALRPLSAQEANFVYADELLLWVNYEGRFKEGKLGNAKQNPLNKPKGVKRPKLRL